MVFNGVNTSGTAEFLVRGTSPTNFLVSLRKFVKVISIGDSEAGVSPS